MESYYRDQAALCAEEAKTTTLAQVRARCQRSPSGMARHGRSRSPLGQGQGDLRREQDVMKVLAHDAAMLEWRITPSGPAEQHDYHRIAR